jgi:hypothetical protein
MLEGFVQDDKKSTIKLLNSVRPLDVIEYVLGYELERKAWGTVEGPLYLSAISDVPVDLQEAFKLGKVWQDLKQTARKHLQGSTLETNMDMVKRFRTFLQGVDASRQRTQ